MLTTLLCVMLASMQSAQSMDKLQRPAPQPGRPTVIAKKGWGEGPGLRNLQILYYDEAFLFVARNYGDSRDFGGNTEPGLFVHSKEKSRWIQILEISTEGGSFGTSNSDDPAARAKLTTAQAGWNFTGYAMMAYMPQPMNAGSSIAFPDRIEYDASKQRYTLRYHSGWKIPSAETVVYINRADLVEAVAEKVARVPTVASPIPVGNATACGHTIPLKKFARAPVARTWSGGPPGPA